MSESFAGMISKAAMLSDKFRQVVLCRDKLLPFFASPFGVLLDPRTHTPGFLTYHQPDSLLGAAA